MNEDPNVKMVNVKNQQDAIKALMEQNPRAANDLLSRPDIWFSVKLGTEVKTGKNKLVVVCNSGKCGQLDELAKEWHVQYTWKDFGGTWPVLRALW